MKTIYFLLDVMFSNFASSNSISHFLILQFSYHDDLIHRSCDYFSRLGGGDDIIDAVDALVTRLEVAGFSGQRRGNTSCGSSAISHHGEHQW